MLLVDESILEVLARKFLKLTLSRLWGTFFCILSRTFRVSEFKTNSKISNPFYLDSSQGVHKIVPRKRTDRWVGALTAQS